VASWKYAKKENERVPKTNLAPVKKEMNQPRVAMSARKTLIALAGIGALVVEHDIQERAMDFEAAPIVVDKTELSEFVHKDADPRTSRANHL
jgi:hypothetical protein